jgi:peptidyl-prolyl cis-trans isomerase SurA
MRARAYLSSWLSAAVVMVLLHGMACAGQTTGTGQRVVLDHLVAVVNRDLILESDLDTEQRMAAFQPFGEGADSREKLIERLVDRRLILQQLQLQPEPPITDVEVDEQLALLRKTIPACAAYHCDTDAGWDKFVATQGVTVDELRARWRMELGVLRFIDERFRMGIRILPADIDAYYQKTMVPAYQKEKVTPPAQATISDRIQEILLQQRVTSLLDDWLKALRAQGSVSIAKPGEALP